MPAGQLIMYVHLLPGPARMKPSSSSSVAAVLSCAVAIVGVASLARSMPSDPCAAAMIFSLALRTFMPLAPGSGPSLPCSGQLRVGVHVSAQMISYSASQCWQRDRQTIPGAMLPSLSSTVASPMTSYGWLLMTSAVPIGGGEGKLTCLWPAGVRSDSGASSLTRSALEFNVRAMGYVVRSVLNDALIVRGGSRIWMPRRMEEPGRGGRDLLRPDSHPVSEEQGGRGAGS